MKISPENKRKAYLKYYATHKEKVKAYNEKYRLEHPEVYREARKRQYRKNPKLSYERSRKWVLENRQRAADSKRLWALENKDRFNETRRLWARNNSDKILRTNQIYRQAHAEQYRLYCATRRARQIGATVGSFDKNDWELLKAFYDYKCCYCKKEMQLTIDHVIPLSKGGFHSKENIVPACKICNSKKGSKTAIMWM